MMIHRLEIKFTKLSSDSSSFSFIFVSASIEHYSKFIKIFLSSDETIFFFFFKLSKIFSRSNSLEKIRNNQCSIIIKRFPKIWNFFSSSSPFDREKDPCNIPSNYRLGGIFAADKTGEKEGRKEGFSRVGVNSSGCETLNFRFITFSSQTR